jgi:serine phosphatase RsbU (regulator of sigma subunit)
MQKIQLAGLPLGVMERVGYNVHDMRLEAGESILLFSDGAFEIENAAGKILGLDGLMGLLLEMGYPRTPLSMPALEEPGNRRASSSMVPCCGRSSRP